MQLVPGLRLSGTPKAIRPWYAAVWRDWLYGLFTPQKGHFNSFCLSFRRSVSPYPTLSLSLSFNSPHLSLSPGIMMCRDICVLDCCLSWAVWLQRAKQHWTGPGQPGSSQRKVSQQKLAGCWLYLKLRGQDNIVKGLIMFFFFFSSCLFPRGTEEGKQSKAELEGV